MTFADLALSRRLERAEAQSCALFADARRRQFPNSGATWIECAGAYAVFDRIESPCTQSFGLGLYEELNPPTLDIVERFFLDRHAPVLHEVSPFAGIPALDLLCKRGYRPEELSSVLYRPVEHPTTSTGNKITVRVIQQDEMQLWSDISAGGWADVHPELVDFLREHGAIAAAREQSFCFLAEIDGVPGAAGALCIHEGVALFAGAATLPEMRKRGLQTALLEERMRFAFDQGCDLAMMVALPGSESQRNVERKGFRIAYTRTKWRLHSAAAN
jgi:GNAT superfamily N-acetyltransferase